MIKWKLSVKSKEERRPRTMKERIATICAAAALVAAAAAAALFIQNKDTLVLRDNLVISMMGSSQEYFGKTKLLYDKHSRQITLKNGQRSLDLNGVPVYQKREGREGPEIKNAVLSRQMIYTNYKTDVIGRINYFGHIGWENQIGTISTDGKKKREVNGGYLFDGKNLYMFLEPVKVSWEEESLELSPLSFISVFNKQGFYYYDPQSGKSEYVSSGESVVRAADMTGVYTLNMSNDIVELSNGKSLLLPPDPESFSLFK